MNALIRTFVSCAVCAFGATAQAQVQITEWMYNGNGATGEYVEFTNLGATAVDFTGWSFDDSSRTPGSTSLSALGLLGAGQSAILTEAAAADFRSVWNLRAGVGVVGDNSNNLGRSDEINLFDINGMLVDRLTYGDVTFPGTIRTQNFSGNPGSLADLIPETVTAGWVLSAAGDSFGSYLSAQGDAGNPGVFLLAVPEPSTYALMFAGLALVGGLARRRAV